MARPSQAQREFKATPGGVRCIDHPRRHAMLYSGGKFYCEVCCRRMRESGELDRRRAKRARGRGTLFPA